MGADILAQQPAASYRPRYGNGFRQPIAALRARFGPEALITRLGAIWLVHLDQPSTAEIQERLAEVERDILEPEDCGLCDPMRPRAGDTLIYDDVMCLIEPAPWRKLYPELDEGEPEEACCI